MKYAWIENDKIRDIAAGNPADIYHPSIAAMYTAEVPDEAQNGDGWVGGVLVKPEPPEPTLPVPPKVSPVEFKLLFTAQERMAIKASTDPVVQDFFELINDPRLTEVNLALKTTHDVLDYLISIDLIEESRKAEILTGVIQ